MSLLESLAPLVTDSETVPESVRETVERLGTLGIWCRFSRNHIATSCQDAARKRHRLGHQGIPLWDELKSFLGGYRDPNGAFVPFLAHCRGDRELDMDKVQQVLDSMGPVARLSAEETSRFGTSYGTVNPFLLADLLQVFDYELMRVLGVPGTVMTNAGDHTWAVELDPAELVMKLPRAKWADIIDTRKRPEEQVFWGVREPEVIGILTGNPMDSGLDLCHALNVHIRRLLEKNSLGDVSMPKVILLSTPQIGISMEMDIREAPLRKALLQGVDELCEAGAKIIAHPAHTTHYFAPEIRERAARKGARFISLVDVLAGTLQRSGIREFALLGTSFVSDIDNPLSIYHNAFRGLRVHKPTPDGWRKIHEIAYEVQQTGPTSKCFNLMRDLLREEVPQTCAHVVLAMTEFSPVIRQLKERGRQGKVLIDPLNFYGEALAREYLGNSPAESFAANVMEEPLVAMESNR